jgi:hypothetical protein
LVLYTASCRARGHSVSLKASGPALPFADGGDAVPVKAYHEEHVITAGPLHVRVGTPLRIIAVAMDSGAQLRMVRNALAASAFFDLTPNRVVERGAQIEI